MGRIAFIVLAVIVVLIWFKLKIRDGERNDEAGRRPDRKKRAVEHMVACSHCGVHVPGPEAVFDARGRAFCSGAHADARPGRT